jgi:hypothetical protein
MNTLVLRGGSLPVVLVAIAAGLLAPAPTAAAATTVETAASAFGLGRYTVTEVAAGGDVTAALTRAAKTPSADGTPTIVHLASGQVTVTQTVRPAANVYLVAESDTKVTWRGKSGSLVRFGSTTGASGIYGGTWDGASRADSVVVTNGATVEVAHATITKGAKHGLGAYTGSRITLRQVSTTSNKVDGVHLEASVLDASGLTSTLNRRNGVQLSSGSSGSITLSRLDRNGRGVSGSTTGKTGHGLGLASSRATVNDTSMSNNKVCGVSLAKRATVTIAASHLDHNGRHGLGTVPGANATISDTTVDTNGYDGVLASGSGTKVTLQDVTITSAKKIGLSVPSHGHASIAGTVITRSGTQNVSVSGGGSLTMLDGNTISRAKQHGISVSGKSRLTVSGSGNVVSSSRRNGLLMTNSGTSGRISAAVSFTDNRDNGIRVTTKARLATVDCRFAGNGRKITTGSGGKVTSLD